MLFYNYTYSASPTYPNNVSYEGDSIIVTIHLPGVRKKEIDISFSDDDGGVTVLSRDHRYFIPIQTSIDADKIEAELELGILTITIPKRDTSHKIKIK